MKAKLALVVTLFTLAFGAGPFAALAVAQNEGAGSGNDVTQDQSASNSNEAEQTAESEATTEQANTAVDTPMWLSHHWPSGYDRCTVIAGRHVCRRCLVLYPVALVAGVAAGLVGLVVPALRTLYDYDWFVGFGVAFSLHSLLMRGTPELDLRDVPPRESR